MNTNASLVLGVACSVTLASGTLAQVSLLSVDRHLTVQGCWSSSFGSPQCQNGASSNTSTGYWSDPKTISFIQFGGGGTAEVFVTGKQESNLDAGGFYAHLTSESKTRTANDYQIQATGSVSQELNVRFHVPYATDAALTNSVASSSGMKYTVTLGPDGGIPVLSWTFGGQQTVRLTKGDWQFRVTGSASTSSSGINSQSYKFAESTVNLTFTTVACVGDFNGDHVVDDADFSVFVAAYNDLICPSYPFTCPADLNNDLQVDDADFSKFVVAYDALECP